MIRARRTTVAIAGLITLAVLAACAFRWRDLAVAYHLHRMEGAPVHWLDAAERPDGTVPKEAARRFLQGDDAFLRVLRSIPEPESGRRGTSETDREDSPRLRAFRALGEMGLTAEAPLRLKIVRQLIGGLDEEIRGAEPPVSSEDDINGARYFEYEAASALTKLDFTSPEAIPV